VVNRGLVIKAVGNNFTIRTNNGEEKVCRIKGNLRIKNIRSTNPVAIGDIALFEEVENSENGFIIDIEERKNYIVRKATNWSKQMHVIAANVDQAILVVSFKDPDTPFDFIDRFLISAEAFRIPVLLVINKTDLYDEIAKEKCNLAVETYQSIGYDCLLTSIPYNINLDCWKNKVQGKINVISGNSGVGKSSLINYINPMLNLKTLPVSEMHKSGMHTTSYSEMCTIPDGGYIIDTPGIKAFGMYDYNKDELYHFFPEIFKAAGRCKYYNCKHIHEPECAVIECVRDGSIKETRYNSYWNLYHDDASKYR
jgi:ribosome biogenesis GTPase / thiamine phosphate phosphatase